MSYERELHEQGKCAEVVMVQTEDGPETGRCKRPIVYKELACCAMHGAERHEWMHMSEWQKAAWEREQERDW